MCIQVLFYVKCILLMFFEKVNGLRHGNTIMSLTHITTLKLMYYSVVKSI